MRRLETITTLSILGAMSALLGGCPIWTGGGPPGPDYDAQPNPDVVAVDATPTDTTPRDTGPVTRTCNSGADCLANQYCDLTTHTCVAGNPCGPSQSCATGFYCDSRTVCEPGCNVNSDCGAGQVCNPTSHSCVAGGQCNAQNPCMTGYTCVDGSCRVNDRVCTFNYQCPSGTCVNGACVANCTAGGNQCIGGQVCVGGYCQTPTPTNTCDTVTCAAGSICANGTCHAQCTNDGQCGAGQFCDNGACRVDTRASVPCSGTGGCATGSACVNGGCHVLCSGQPSGTDLNMFCMMRDSAYVSCGSISGQMVCLIANETNPQCTASMPCSGTGTCINGTCH